MFHNIDFQNVAVKFQEIVTLDIQIGFRVLKINVLENRRSNEELTIQRHKQHLTQNTKRSETTEKRNIKRRALRIPSESICSRRIDNFCFI
jgi:hypothetical protein